MMIRFYATTMDPKGHQHRYGGTGEVGMRELAAVPIVQRGETLTDISGPVLYPLSYLIAPEQVAGLKALRRALVKAQAR